MDVFIIIKNKTKKVFGPKELKKGIGRSVITYQLAE